MRSRPEASCSLPRGMYGHTIHTDHTSVRSDSPVFIGRYRHALTHVQGLRERSHIKELSLETLTWDVQVEIKRPKMGQIGGQVAPFSTISYL